MPTADINLPYFKQGDDFGSCLGQSSSPVEALELHAKMLEGAALQLRQIKALIIGHDVDMDGDTHSIWITADDELIKKMEELELVTIYDWGEE